MPSSAIEKTERLPLTQAAITPMELLQNAVTQGTDIDKMTKLLELQERWEANEARKAFNAAMTQFKANPPRIVKNISKRAGQIDLHYASLDNVVETITGALSRVGIRHHWETKQDNAQLTVSCVLSHEKGHSQGTSLSAPYDNSGGKNAIQAIASAVTYLERYTLLAATGLAAGADDDGDSALRMPEAQEVEYLDWIKNAATLEDLQKVFGTAYKAAAANQATRTMEDLIKARDAQRLKLQGGAR